MFLGNGFHLELYLKKHPVSSLLSIHLLIVTNNTFQNYFHKLFSSYFMCIQISYINNFISSIFDLTSKSKTNCRT